jgi:aspartate aminotransferase
MIPFSENISTLTPSATLALSARAKQLQAEGRSVIDLSAGQPEFPTPAVASEAAIQSIHDGRTGYPPTAGIPSLRQAIVDYLAQTTEHSHCAVGDVIVSAGVKQALFNVAFCLFQAGDEVLVPAPYWPTYPAIIRLAGATPVIVPTAYEDGFQLDPEALERARTDRTVGLMLNSPGNPSGAVYSLDVLTDVASWASRHGIWILSDEIYRRLCYISESAPSVYDVADRAERVVLLDGVSKSFAMTGWRIGFAVGPSELIAKASALQSQTTSGAASPSQYAAAAMYGDVESREAAIREYRGLIADRREMAAEALAGLTRLETPKPDGAIYLFTRLSDGGDSMAVAEDLLMNGGVACVPGDPFGAPGFLRFNLAVEEDTLAEGLRRLTAFFGE